MYYCILTLLPLIFIGVGLLITIFSSKGYALTSPNLNIDYSTIFNGFFEQTFARLFVYFTDISGESVIDYLGRGVFSEVGSYGFINFIGLFSYIFIDFDMIVDYSSIWLFINWYLNYILMIQLIMFIPRIIMWFINWSFNMIDTLSYKGGLRK